MSKLDTERTTREIKVPIYFSTTWVLW